MDNALTPHGIAIRAYLTDHSSDELPPKIRDGCTEPIATILKVAESPVAVPAQKTSDLECRVVMVDMEMNRVAPWFFGRTDGTHSTLCEQNSVVILSRNSVPRAQPIYASLTANLEFSSSFLCLVAVEIDPLASLGSMAFITSIPKDRAALPLEREVAVREALLAFTTCSEFHGPILIRGCENGHPRNMVPVDGGEGA